MASPAGILSLPLSFLKTALSESSNFQTWVSAGTPAAALTSIHLVSTTTLTTPAVVITWAGGSGNREALLNYEIEGELIMRFFGVVVDETDAGLGNEAIDFMNVVGAVLGDVLDNSATAGSLDITGWSHGPPTRPTQEEAANGDYHLVSVAVSYVGSA